MLDSEIRSAQAGAFGAAAALYERARPGYPEGALEWLLPQNGHRVLDLGAGTGKLTRLIAQHDVEVEAVDPSPQMLAQLREQLPQVRTRVGSAESIPLPDASVDAVLVGQAWHWVDVPVAAAEVARVLRRGGRLGLIWNERDERVAWVRELSEILGRRGAQRMSYDNPLFGAQFGQIEYLVQEWADLLTPAGLIELVASRSYVILAGLRERTAILGAVQDLLESHPDLEGREQIELPYITYASRAHLA